MVIVINNKNDRDDFEITYDIDAETLDLILVI